MEFKLVRGTKDILPDEARLWKWIEDVVHRVFRLYGYEEIRTPLFETVSVFERGIGEETEIVSKQMYTFVDKKGRVLALRPEGTAGIVRAYLEHQLAKRPSPIQLYYIGPMFRYERPQAGRQRQFWQFGCEVFGNLPPVRDAELIQMVLYLFSELGLKDGLQTIVNSIGCKGCRPAYVERLSEYFQETLELLCDDCRRKAKRNPLRILDCKREKCQNVSKGAPLIESYLCSSCSLHMREALRYLDYLKVNYEVNPRLVRGLDYYTRTVFEIIDSSLGAKDALAAGGRYDDLVEDFGGPSTSAIGFAAGIERIILSLKNSNLQQNLKEKIDIYITAISDRAIETVLKVAKDLRANGIRTKTGYKERSLKKEARLAARLGVRFLLVIGEDEIKAGVVKPKDILKYKELEEVQIGRIVEWAKRSLRR